MDSAASGDSPLGSSRHIVLDGRTLEGGGQLVRNALALAALTSRPVTINHVRGNRGGKPGLKASHTAAVKLLAEISQSKIIGGTVGSQTITFEPQTPSMEELKSLPDAPHTSSLVSLSNISVKSEYNIRLPTPGSVFLIFQALYPYLLHVGSRAAGGCIKVTMIGGTNGTSAPTYDYASQVMAPNFARLGLPPLSITLQKRGWTVGPIEMGSVTFLIHPLSSVDNEQGVPDTRFPKIDLMSHERGKVTQVDVTVLAPDTPLPKAGKTVRKYIEKEVCRSLRRALRSMGSSGSNRSIDELDDREDVVPIKGHTSEPTNHASQVYILLVAHTANGFRIGHDALISSRTPGKAPKKNKNAKKAPRQSNHKGDRPEDERERITSCIDELVTGFMEEISIDSGDQTVSGSTTGKRSVLDAHMRDQVVVFEALGETHGDSRLGHQISPVREDDRYWTLHTKTAQWVCQRMLLETNEAIQN